MFGVSGSQPRDLEFLIGAFTTGVRISHPLHALEVLAASYCLSPFLRLSALFVN